MKSDESAVLKEEDLQLFKNMLIKQLQDLIHQADDTMTGMLESYEMPPDPLDRALLESGQNFSLRIRDRESKLIKKIRKALDRIDSGEFGICEICGEDIALARLKARPVTTKCIDCKVREEAMEKAMGD